MRQKKSSRRQARELAFQALYRLAFVTDPDEAAFRRAFEALPRAEGRRRLSSQAEGFAWELAAGAWRERERLDDILGRFSQNWKVARMARIDLALLRLGLFELLRRPDVPLKVAINEAVELAKTYGDGKTPGFVNGILDAAARAVEKGELQQQALTAQAA